MWRPATCALICVLASCGAARRDASAREVSQWVDGYYSATVATDTPFEGVIVLQGHSLPVAGRLSVARPGRFRYEVAALGAAAVSDGARVLIQDRPGAHWFQEPAAWDRYLGLLIGTRTLGEHYQTTLSECPGAPRESVCIAIVPNTPDDAYVRHRLAVSSMASNRGAIVWMEVADSAGLVETLTFLHEAPALGLEHAPSTFSTIPAVGSLDLSPWCESDNLPMAGCPAGTEDLHRD